MRLSEKLILFVLTAAIVPLTLVAFGLLRQSERELTVRITEQQRAVASAAAEEVGSELMSAINGLATSAAVIDWRSASRDEVAGGLKLLYAQSDLISAVVLADPTRQDDLPGPVVDQPGHPAADAMLALAPAFPLDSLGARGERGQIAVLPVAFHGAEGFLRVAIQVGPRSQSAPFAVAELALSGLNPKLAHRASATVGELELVDSDNRVVVGTAGPAGVPLRDGRRDVLRSAQGIGRSADGERVASAEVPNKLGLFVTVSLADDVALAPVHALRRTILLGTVGTLALLVAVAVAFTRRLNARLRKVGGAAEAYAKGELSTRIEVGGADELTDLATTFNRMGSELEAARLKLTRWNDELKQRVDEATADLRAAQARLVEAQKLAAIGQLGAGVAHEINNPLCGILGNAQLLMLDSDPGGDAFALLKTIEDSAKRCRDITQNLLRFSQTQGEASLRPVDLNAVIRGSLDFEELRFAEAKVTVEAQLSSGPLQVMGDPEQLSQVLAAMFSNSRTAMAKSPVRTLTVRTRPTASGAELVVVDTGKGIPAENLTRVFDPFFTTKDVWSNIGLGLSVAYRIVKEHDGRIDVESKPGQGATFTVRLPPFEVARQRTQKAAPAEGLEVGGQGLGIVR